MGCVSGKLSPTYNDRFKQHNGYYVEKVHIAKPISVSTSHNNLRPTSDNKAVLGPEPKPEPGPTNRVSTSKVEDGGTGEVEGGNREKVVVGNNGREVKSEIWNVSRKKIGRDEYVDGWPKWLVDNIPSSVLATILPRSADSYEKLAKIGRGTYSNVYKARDKETGKIVAMKKVRFDTSDSESIKFMAREIMILQKLDHPNIIKLEGLATSRMQYSLYLVFEYMHSDLTRIITRPGERLTEAQIKRYMQQLLCGLEHCHERGVMHRDIKGSNLLIDKKGFLKIADFGLANSFDLKPKGPFTNRVVTLWYRAPELLLGSTDYGFSIDLWSVGCLLAEMFHGKPLMPGRTEVEQLHMIFKLCGSPSDDYWKKLRLMTSYRPPHYKPTFEDEFKDIPSSSHSLLTTLLDLDPSYRGTASSALSNQFFNTSPKPCDLSALPVIYKDEDERSQTKRRKRHRYLRKVSQSAAKNQIGGEQRASESLKEGGQKKKNVETASSIHEQQETTGHNSGSSSSSTSSGFTKNTTEQTSISTNASASPMLSPVFLSTTQKKSSNTDAHPGALKNIHNFFNIHHPTQLNDPSHLRKSFSSFDLRLENPHQLKH